MTADDRVRRIGLNEATFRAVNESAERLNADSRARGEATMNTVCECGSLDCMRQLLVPITKYERVRADATLFIVVPGHEIPEVEEVVAHGDGYDVIRKHPGRPAQVARETA